MNEEDKKAENDLRLHLDDGKNLELVQEDLKQKARENAEKVAELDQKKKLEEAEKAPVGKDIAEALHTDPHDPLIKPLRTFQGDVAEAIERQKTSLIKIKMAEEKRRESEERASPHISGTRYGIKAIILVLSIIFILVGGTIFAITKYFAGTPDDAPVAVYDTLIPYGTSEKINVSRTTRNDLIGAFASLRKEHITPLSIKYLKLSGGPDGSTAIPTSKLFSILSTSAPQELIRSFDDTFMAGGYGAQTTEPFLLIRIDSFDNAYSGMLSWEDTMMDDIGPLFTPEHVAFTASQTQVSLPDASSSTSVTKGRQSIFQDLVIGNRDTRAVRDDHGAIVLVYSFIDHNILLVTTNEEAFKGMVAKLTAAKLIR